MSPRRSGRPRVTGATLPAGRPGLAVPGAGAGAAPGARPNSAARNSRVAGGPVSSSQTGPPSGSTVSSEPQEGAAPALQVDEGRQRREAAPARRGSGARPVRQPSRLLLAPAHAASTPARRASSGSVRVQATGSSATPLPSPEGERRAGGAHDQLLPHPLGEPDERLRAGAVLGHEVVDLEAAERLDHPVDPLGGEAGQVEAAEHRVDLRRRRSPGSALRQMPTIPRWEHDVTTTRPRSRTWAISVCSPMKVSWTSAPSCSIRSDGGIASYGSVACISPESSTPSRQHDRLRHVHARPGPSAATRRGRGGRKTRDRRPAPSSARRSGSDARRTGGPGRIRRRWTEGSRAARRSGRRGRG